MRITYDRMAIITNKQDRGHTNDTIKNTVFTQFNVLWEVWKSGQTRLVKNPPTSAADVGLISGGGTKIPQVAGQIERLRAPNLHSPFILEPTEPQGRPEKEWKC